MPISSRESVVYRGMVLYISRGSGVRPYKSLVHYLPQTPHFDLIELAALVNVIDISFLSGFESEQWNEDDPI